jgi:hypothetical protein
MEEVQRALRALTARLRSVSRSDKNERNYDGQMLIDYAEQCDAAA